MNSEEILAQSLVGKRLRISDEGKVLAEGVCSSVWTTDEIEEGSWFVYTIQFPKIGAERNLHDRNFSFQFEIIE